MAQVLEESKALVRNVMKVDLEQANEKECEVLKKIWGSAQGMDSMLKYLQNRIDEFWWDARDTGIVFLGHQGKQNKPILKTLI